MEEILGTAGQFIKNCPAGNKMMNENGKKDNNKGC